MSPSTSYAPDSAALMEAGLIRRVMADILSLLGTFLLLALSLIYARGCECLKPKVIPMLGQALLIVICVGLFGYLLEGLLWRAASGKSRPAGAD